MRFLPKLFAAFAANIPTQVHRVAVLWRHVRLTARAGALVAMIAAVTVWSSSAYAQGLTVVGRAAAETFATEIAFDSTLRRAFVTNNWTNSVTVIDTTDYRTLARIDVGARPNGIVIDPDAHRAYVANWGSHNISVIDTASLAVVTQVLVGNGAYPYSAYPTMVALNVSSGRLYVTHDVPAGTVSVIDTSTMTTIDQVITNGGSSVGIAFDDTSNRVFATTYGSQLFAIDASTHQILWRVTGTGSGHVRWSPSEGLYVGSNSFVDGVQGVTKVDPDAQTIVARAALGNVGVFAAGGPYNRVYAPQYWNDRLAVFGADLQSELGSFATCCHSTSAAVDPLTGLVWFADELGNIAILRDDIRPPLQAEGQEVTMQEDSRANITLSSTGGQEPTLYTIISGPSSGAASVAGAEVTYVPAANFAGTDQFTFRVSSGGATSTATVRVIVVPVNDAPQLSVGGPYQGLVGDQVTVTATASDVEDGVASIAWDLDGNGSFETPGASAVLTITLPGVQTVAVRATDADGAVSLGAVAIDGRYGACLLYRTDHAVRSGATVPLRVQLCDARAVNVSSPALALSAVTLVRLSDQVSAVVEDAGQANPDSNFRYDATLAGYVFNFQTTGLTTGTYALVFTATGSDHQYHAPFQVK